VDSSRQNEWIERNRHKGEGRERDKGTKVVKEKRKGVRDEDTK
jgi:hypothetical protein